MKTLKPLAMLTCVVSLFLLAACTANPDVSGHVAATLTTLAKYYAFFKSQSDEYFAVFETFKALYKLECFGLSVAATLLVAKYTPGPTLRLAVAAVVVILLA